jgi:glycosyltransferase involved in cell wall biosynthesis
MSTKIKILVVSNYSNTVSARPEAEIFLKLAEMEVEVEIMTDENSTYANRFKNAGIAVIHHTPSSKISPSSISLIKKTLKKGDHDIMLLYNSKAIINGLLSAMFLKTKVVLYRGCAGNISSWDPFAYLKYLNPRVDKVICNAESASNLLKKQFFFKNSKAVTIMKGHDSSWYNSISKKDLSAFKSPKDSFLVCCAANARPVKGVRYLIEAMKYIGKDYPIQLLLLGSGHDDKTNTNLIKSQELSNVHMLGFRTDSLSIVKACDVFVLPSLGQETLTKSVIEAMSMGVTCTITNVSGNKYLIDHNRTGLIVPTKNPKAIANSIMELFDNKLKHQELGLQGQRHIQENLSSEKTAQEYLQLFKDLVSSN